MLAESHPVNRRLGHEEDAARGLWSPIYDEHPGIAGGKAMMPTRTSGRGQRNRLGIMLALLLAAVVWLAVGSGRFAGVTAARSLPPQEFADAFRKAKSAALSVARSGHPWAGVYTQEDPTIPGRHGSTLVIASTGHYTYETENCMGGGPEHFGRARLRGDSVIELTPEYCRAGRSARGRVDFLLVRWGERHYMIFGRSVPHFQIAVENGDEPRNSIKGDFLLRRGDWDIPVSGPPELP